MLFDYPKRATFGRVIPKTKIYDKAKVTQANKNLFVKQVEQILWQYKLAPETINVSRTRAVPEIEILRIAVKNSELNYEVLRCIDRAIPFPLIFELCFEDKVKIVAGHKRPNDADSSKWVVSEYFETDWLSIDATRRPLPLAQDLGRLYAQLLETLFPYPARHEEELKARVERMETIRKQELQLTLIESRLRKERQFNRKVEINAELRSLRLKIDKLTSTQPI